MDDLSRITLHIDRDTMPADDLADALAAYTELLREYLGNRQDVRLNASLKPGSIAVQYDVECDEDRKPAVEEGVAKFTSDLRVYEGGSPCRTPLPKKAMDSYRDLLTAIGDGVGGKAAAQIIVRAPELHVDESFDVAGEPDSEPEPAVVLEAQDRKVYGSICGTVRDLRMTNDGATLVVKEDLLSDSVRVNVKRNLVEQARNAWYGRAILTGEIHYRTVTGKRYMDADDIEILGGGGERMRLADLRGLLRE